MKNLFLKLAFALAAMFVTSTMVAAAVTQVTGFDFELVRAVIAGVSLVVAIPSGALAVVASQTITDFADEFGAYYRPGGQNMERLKKLLMQNHQPWDDEFTLTPLEGDVLEYGLMAHTRVLQPFKPVWSPTGELSGTPRKLTLRRVKVNVAEIPDYFVNNWLGFLASEGGKDPNVDRATWPFVRWYVEKYLIPQAKEDQYYESFYGIYADPGTNSTPGAHGTALDGLAYLLNFDIDEGNINPIPSGALETDPIAFVEQIDAWVEQINNRYRGMPMNLNMHDVLVQRYRQGREELGQAAGMMLNEQQLISVRLRSNIKLKGHFNMVLGNGGSPSEKIWCTPNMNALKAVRVGNKENSMLKLEQVDYTLKMFNDWHVYYGYYDPRIVFTNDRDLTYGGF